MPPLYICITSNKSKPCTDHNSIQSIAATALFLATKTEENCRKTKEIVIAVAKVAQKNASLIIDEQSKEYWRWRDAMLLYEEAMLEYLTFDLVLTSPYSILYSFLQQLRIEEHKQIRNCAWAFINDSCMTMLCLAMPAKDIAVAACYFAIKFNNETIPDDEETGEPWWETLGGRPKRIVEAVGILNEFWTSNPLQKSENPYKGNAPSSSEDLDRTRRRAGSDVSSVISPPSVTGNEFASPLHSALPVLKRKEDGHGEESQPKRAKVEEVKKLEDAEADLEEGEERNGDGTEEGGVRI